MLKLILIAFILCLSLKSFSNVELNECGDDFETWARADYECLEFNDGYLYRSDFKDQETFIEEVKEIDEETFEADYILVEN